MEILLLDATISVLPSEYPAASGCLAGLYLGRPPRHTVDTDTQWPAGGHTAV